MPLIRIIAAAVAAIGTPTVAYGGWAPFSLSGNGGREAAAPTTIPVEDDAASADAFVDCMRRHGLTAFPNATVVDGRLVFKPHGPGVDPFSNTYRQALGACASQLPEGIHLPADPEPPSPHRRPRTARRHRRRHPLPPRHRPSVQEVARRTRMNLVTIS